MAEQIKPRGVSGQDYAFSIYPDGQAFNPVSGVYLFCKRLVTGSYEVLYVGETKSFQERLGTPITGHDGYVRARKLGMTHIAAMTVVGDAERLRIETDLRHGLNPSANAQGVSHGFFK